MAHVSLITLGVDDLGRAAAFYEALGWQRSSASVEDTVVFLRGGTVALALFGRHDLATESGVPSPTGPARDVAMAVNLPSASAVDAFVAAATAHGGRVTAPPRTADWGGYSGYLTDPDGHLWEVAWNPGLPLDEHGSVTLPP